ncbi:MAG: BrnA antitoxin family protein [Holophaga sp.]|nr:BrnA antitoxin family protein [Holophaga sp.]
MGKPQPLIDEHGEVKGLTAEDMKQFKPIHEAGLPDPLMKKLGVRGPQKAPTKVRVSLRLSHEVVDYFRATGEGWQTRMDSELLEMVHRHKAG